MQEARASFGAGLGDDRRSVGVDLHGEGGIALDLVGLVVGGGVDQRIELRGREEDRERSAIGDVDLAVTGALCLHPSRRGRVHQVAAELARSSENEEPHSRSIPPCSSSAATWARISSRWRYQASVMVRSSF